jgi:hypothetical protein
MKYIPACILFCIVFSGCASSLPNMRTPDSSEKQYKISFFAFNRGTMVDKDKKSIAGHASISIDRMGVWGFYPAKEGKPITKKGILKYAEEYPRTQEYADFIVDETTMNKILDFITEWETNPPTYAVPVNDCVSFLYRICDIIGLKYNHLTLLPIWAVRDIRNKNDQNKLYEND